MIATGCYLIVGLVWVLAFYMMTSFGDALENLAVVVLMRPMMVPPWFRLFGLADSQ